MGNYSVSREKCDNLASSNCIVTIFLVFNNWKLQQQQSWPCIFLEKKCKHILELLFLGGLVAQVIYIDKINIEIIVIFSQAIIDIEKFQYCPAALTFIEGEPLVISIIIAVVVLHFSVLRRSGEMEWMALACRQLATHCYSSRRNHCTQRTGDLRC